MVRDKRAEDTVIGLVKDNLRYIKLYLRTKRQNYFYEKVISHLFLLSWVLAAAVLILI